MRLAKEAQEPAIDLKYDAHEHQYPGTAFPGNRCLDRCC